MYKFARNSMDAKFGKQGQLSQGFGSKQHMRSKVKDLVKNLYYDEKPQHSMRMKGIKSGEVFNSSFEK